MTDRLVVSVAEAAEVLGVSDDLVYELTERGDLPCLRFGRRKLIPLRAIELMVEQAVADFDPTAARNSLGLAERVDAPCRTGSTRGIAPRSA